MLDSGAIQVFINGVKLPMKDIVEVNDHTIRIPEGLVPTDRVLVRYTQLSDLVGEKHSHNHLLDGGDAIPLATIDSEGLMSKGDKVKLNSIEVNANNYTHPTTHSSEMIVDTAQKRFVTDAEKTKWNAKAEASLVYSKQEVDTKIQTISSTTYTKQEVNIAITNACQEFTTREDVYGKIANNSENFYTKQEIDEKLSIGSESIYTKEQIDEKISGTSDLFYSKAEVDAKIAEIMSIIGQLESKN